MRSSRSLSPTQAERGQRRSGHLSQGLTHGSLSPGGPTSHVTFQETKAQGREVTLKVTQRLGRQSLEWQASRLASLPGTLLPFIPRCLGDRWGHAHTGLTRDTLTLGDTLTHIGAQRSGDTCHLSRNPHWKPLHTRMPPPPQQHPTPRGEKSPTHRSESPVLPQSAT